MSAMTKRFWAKFPPKKQAIESVGSMAVDEDMPPIDYAELAKKAGFTAYEKVLKFEAESQTLQCKQRQFRKFLAENGIAVFPLEKVQRYLQRIKPQPDDMWDDVHILWRNITRGVAYYNHLVRENINGIGQVGDDGPYNKIIPAPVLMTIAKIKESWPDAEFFVSDFTHVLRPDPFLAVVANKEFFVIERWDEPAFRM